MARGINYNYKIRRFLEILREKEYETGENIARNLAISRAAVSKFAKYLKNLGYSFEIKKRYKLIKSPDIPFPWELGDMGKKVIFFHEVDSTQNIARELFIKRKLQENFWVIALKQTSGKGRLGRRWESPEGNFYGSCVIRPDIPIKEVIKISLLGGLAVFKAIQSFSPIYDVKIKWPNDVFIIGREPKKISGTIAEAFGEAEKIDFVVVGIGVNVKIAPLNISISLKDIVNNPSYVSLVEFTKKLIRYFMEVFGSFCDGKWLELKTDIENNLWRGRVKVDTGRKSFSGICYGIAEDGSMIVQKEDGSFESVYYGDTFIYF
ncbi:Bifunctional ligase/repressor BirA [bacterium HR19]|nr:Bifunctional ligase/repressor BirA [bacterium HR19]